MSFDFISKISFEILSGFELFYHCITCLFGKLAKAYLFFFKKIADFRVERREPKAY